MTASAKPPPIALGFSKHLTATICVGEGANIQPKEFPVFGYKALCGIGALPSTVADRSIEIRLRATCRASQGWITSVGNWPSSEGAMAGICDDAQTSHTT